jgi:hypothetical protein
MTRLLRKREPVHSWLCLLHMLRLLLCWCNKVL